MAGTVYHKHMTQRVPSSPTWQYDCTAYCMAMLVNDSTLGGLQSITGRRIRLLSNEPTPDPASPGLNLQQMKAVAGKLRIPFYLKTGEPWAKLVARVGREGASRAILQVDYDIIQAQAPGLACQRTGDFDHALLIVNVHDGKVRASDPLCSGTKEYPEMAIKAAADKFGRDHGMVGGGLYYAVSRVVPKWTT